MTLSGKKHNSIKITKMSKDKIYLLNKDILDKIKTKSKVIIKKHIERTLSKPNDVFRIKLKI